MLVLLSLLKPRRSGVLFPLRAADAEGWQSQAEKIGANHNDVGPRDDSDGRAGQRKAWMTSFGAFPQWRQLGSASSSILAW